MQTINAKYTSTKQKDAQEVSLYIEGLPSGGSVENGSITTDKLASKAVTADKIADGVIPEEYTLPAASASALGVMSQTPPVTRRPRPSSSPCATPWSPLAS